MRLSPAKSPTGAVFLLLTYLPSLISATPAVNVALKASWSGAPFLLELLETAAAENPLSYFPLLDRIAAGDLNAASTDKELYARFLEVANAAGYLTSPAEVSSFNLGLSIHAAAPRIEAHYQYYDTGLEPLMGAFYKPECKVWLQWSSKQHCEFPSDPDSLLSSWERYPNEARELAFDRVLGNKTAGSPAAILYGDVQTPEFKGFHEKLREHAEKGKISYRVRYRRTPDSEGRELGLSGYGVSLVLKKTDYMVMDDRDTGESEEKKEKEDVPQVLDDEEVQNLKPLHGRDLALLGAKATSFVMNSDDPLDTLRRLVQDFPKHQAAVAAAELDKSLVQELYENFETAIGSGRNRLWINGLRMEESQINAFALLEHLRRERRLIDGLTTLGINSSEAIDLLSHDAIAASQEDEQMQRFDYRDQVEQGNVIIWLNDLEKDKRYAEWSSAISMLMRRVYPGQLHPLRKNIHHLVFPVDFSSREDLVFVTGHLLPLVKKKIALRFGLVTLGKTKEAQEQAMVYSYLADTFGLRLAMEYLELVLAEKAVGEPTEKIFSQVNGKVEPRKDRTPKSLEEVLSDENLQEKISRSKSWCSRMGATSTTPSLFVNGLPMVRDENWTQQMTQLLQNDVMRTQMAVYQGEADDTTDFTEILLEGAAMRRNVHIFPDSEASLNVVKIADIVSDETFSKLPTVASESSDLLSGTSLWVVADFDQQTGYELLRSAVEMQQSESGVDLVLLHSPGGASSTSLSALLFTLPQMKALTPEILGKLLDEVVPSSNISQLSIQDIKSESWSVPDKVAAAAFWEESASLIKKLGLQSGQRSVVVNGRVVGPIPSDDEFGVEDLKTLVELERTKRIKPVLQAVEDLGLQAKIKNGRLGLATLTNQVYLTNIPETPPGIFDSLDYTRTNVVKKMTSTSHSSVSVGAKDSAVIQLVASLDPASETAQKWIPILYVLSNMHGVYLKILLNPARTITELPVKRFYRHVLAAEPVFSESGAFVDPHAHFEHIPGQPLLSLSMDVPPSWLVTPKDSIHDLDNVKLDAMAERLNGDDVEATYELRNILIEGHILERTSKQPPRGAQFVLGTKKNPHFADTIVMANLGYFQFKANPGIWKMEFKEGRSNDIFELDKLGTKGPETKAGEDDPDIAMLTFQGVTLWPKASRKPGMEEEDVLEVGESNKPLDVAKKWFDKAQSYLGTKSTAVAETQHAEINIFSVASGHLYERFLGIMILSVMKHTDKTVKFWFIENFLSPSFKDFLPHLSAEYGFSYELVTYKWPHWLRAQKEKQREIWGYKILFLDVLFPLSLDKVIFVDADQIVRTDMSELNEIDLHGAPYGFTPMCDSREEIEGFRFWKQGYWKTFLRGLPYHISALYVVDLKRFRQIAAGDRLRGQYHQLSADPESLSNLDQDLPNHMQQTLPIFSLPQEWLWCETWCSDESLEVAKTIDLCNNPMTKEPKLDRARRQVPEWVGYDEEVADVARRRLKGGVEGGHLGEAAKGAEGKVDEEKSEKSEKAEEKEQAEDRVRDEL